VPHRTVGRSWRWLREQFAFLIVVGGVLAGFLVLLVWPGHWRRGTGLIGAALVLAAALRLLLRGYAPGLLAVRNRWVDTVLYLVVGGLILAVDIRLNR